MQYDELVGQVQNRARLSSTGDAVRAIRVTLETLAERLTREETKDLAAQLPQEIGRYLQESFAAEGERFSLDDFFQRLSIREGVDVPEAVFHARVVLEVLQEAVSKGEIDHVRAQLPPEFAPLFEAGSTGELRHKETTGGTHGNRSAAGQESGKRLTGAKAGQMSAAKLKEIITPNPEVISPNSTLREAAKKMRSLNVGMLPVVDGGRLVGTLTDRDITIRATAEGRDPSATQVAQAMSTEVISCYEDELLKEAIQVMEEKQIRRLPVMSRDNRLVGIVSLGDLAVRTQKKKLAGEVLERVSEPAGVAD